MLLTPAGPSHGERFDRKAEQSIALSLWQIKAEQDDKGASDSMSPEAVVCRSDPHATPPLRA